MERKTKIIILHITGIVLFVGAVSGIWGYTAGLQKTALAEYKQLTGQLTEGNEKLAAELEASRGSLGKLTAGIGKAQDSIRDSVQSATTIDEIIQAIRSAVQELSEILEE